MAQDDRLMRGMRAKRPRTTTTTASTKSESIIPGGDKFDYTTANYWFILQDIGYFNKESDAGVTDKSKEHCKTLLKLREDIPARSLFDNECYRQTIRKLENANKARVLRDIGQLIVPSADTLTTLGDGKYEALAESIDQAWASCHLIIPKRPRPDYTVGFGRTTAFNTSQQKILRPYIGAPGDMSFFAVTSNICFPFLTSEAKSASVSIGIADRQNANSAYIAVRAVVNLFKMVKRESELHREILAFSVSYDHRAVCIYGHYAELVGRSEPVYYRKVIHELHTSSERWAAYSFVRNLYDNWAPAHLQRILTAVDQIPLTENRPTIPPTSSIPHGVGWVDVATGKTDTVSTDVANALTHEALPRHEEDAIVEEQTTQVNLEEQQSRKRKRLD